MQDETTDLDLIGRQMHELAAALYPICRSVTGPGVRETMAVLRERIPSLEVREVPSGTKVFDWTVPEEWHVADAYILDPAGNRVVDFRKLNLHLVGGSVPIRTRLSWRELKPRLHTIPEHPNAVPYRTSFYERSWGFCLSHREFLELEARGEQEYEVVIDSKWRDGSLTYGDAYLPGETEEEVLVWAHTCHPSVANDNLSGIVVAARLAEALARETRRYSYRFVFAPATIGAITWLAVNESRVARVKHGVVLAGVGDPGPFHYRKSRRGDTQIDRAFAHVLRHGEVEHAVAGFKPFGYDQRQLCSPAFDLSVGCLMRALHGEYPEYHSSADNLEFIRPHALAETWQACKAAFDLLEANRVYLNLKPKCEPRLGDLGLYHAYGQRPDAEEFQRAILWILNLSDGSHSLLDIAERADLDFSLIARAADALSATELLDRSEEPSIELGNPLAHASTCPPEEFGAFQETPAHC